MIRGETFRAEIAEIADSVVQIIGCHAYEA